MPGITKNSALVIRVPVRLCKKAGRKMILTPDGQRHAYTAPETDDALVNALLRAHQWNDALETGKARTAGELAAKEKVNASYLGRMLRLTLLAPDIKQAILDGRQPRGLRLLDMLKPFPLLWEEQRKWFSF